jgi:hypothetical protein
MRLAQAVESQFDTAVTAAFEAILTSADSEYRMGTRFDFGLDGRQAEEATFADVPASLRVAHAG